MGFESSINRPGARTSPRTCAARALSQQNPDLSAQRKLFRCRTLAGNNSWRMNLAVIAINFVIARVESGSVTSSCWIIELFDNRAKPARDSRDF